MKKITLKLTAGEARTVYHALIHASTDAEKAIDVAAAFPESDILREAAERAEKEKLILDAMVNRLLEGLSREQWDAVILGGENHG